MEYAYLVTFCNSFEMRPVVFSTMLAAEASWKISDQNLNPSAIRFDRTNAHQVDVYHEEQQVGTITAAEFHSIGTHL